MTFIASVVAKNGCAIVADSLVTSMGRVMGWGDFTVYVESKKGKDGAINLDAQEMASLFNSKPSHTKNYEEKLFIYDAFSVVTTAGSASINGYKIEELIEELILLNNADPQHEEKELETKVIGMCEFFARKVADHVKKSGQFSGTNFIYTNYNKDNHKTSIYKILIHPCGKKEIEDPDFKRYSFNLQPDFFHVVCDGQNRISEKILFGDFEATSNLIPKVVKRLADEHGLKVDVDEYSEKIFKDLQDDGSLENLRNDMKIFQLSKLSLQQAVDLACLLMRIEMDFQQYTQNIPTVGGLIKLATIDKTGAKIRTGDEITKPEFIR